MDFLKKVNELLNQRPVWFIAMSPILFWFVSIIIGIIAYIICGNQYISVLTMIIFEFLGMLVAYLVFRDKEIFIEIYTKLVDELLLIIIAGLVVVSELQIISRFITSDPKSDFIFLGVIVTCQKLFIELFAIHEKAKKYKEDHPISKENDVLDKIRSWLKKEISEVIRLLNKSRLALFLYFSSVMMLVLYLSTHLPDFFVTLDTKSGILFYFLLQFIFTIVLLWISRKIIDKDNLKKVNIFYPMVLDVLLTVSSAYILVMAEGEVLDIAPQTVKILGTFYSSQKIFYIVLKAKNEWEKTKSEETN